MKNIVSGRIKRSIEMKMGDSTTNGTDKAVENVIIIGSGPAGFTAGLYAGRASLSPLLLTGNDYGGQVTITYDIENYPGFPESLSGPDLVEKFKTQAEKFGTRVEYDYVNEIVVDRHPFVVRTSGGQEYATKSIILATGARSRYLEVPGEKEFTGKGISYSATCDGFFFRGKDVLVVGGGDSATEEALFLTRFAHGHGFSTAAINSAPARFCKIGSFQREDRSRVEHRD